MEWFKRAFLASCFLLLGGAQSFRLYERHPMCPHVSVQVSLCLKQLPADFALGIWCPVVVFIRNIQLVLSLTFVVVVFAPAVSG